MTTTSTLSASTGDPVTDKTVNAVRCLAAGLLLGILADALLRVGPWGLNATIAAGALAACLWGFSTSSRRPLNLLIAVFGMFFVWRDSPVLKCLDGFAIASICLTIALPETVSWIARSTVCDYLAAAFYTCAGAIIGTPLLAHEELRPGDGGLASTRAQWQRTTMATVVGLIIAVPLLLVFGGLFVSADTAFRDFVHTLMDWNWDDLAGHVVVTGGVFWMAAGFFRMLVFTPRTEASFQAPANAMRLDTPAIMVPLTLLNVLFIAFIAVQFRYFFGGDALVAQPDGPTYSAYARHGFFQLVIAAALALVVLYAADWLHRGAAPTARAWFRALAAVLIVLVYVVMASALHRMYLYYEAYGLTELRFYTTAFMAWLAVVLATFAATVLRGQRDRFLFAAIAAAWAAVIALHAANPDATIVRANLARVESDAAFDTSYNGALSADAVPALVNAAVAKANNDVAAAIYSWMNRRQGRSTDWRTWNWSQSRSIALLERTGFTPERAAIGTDAKQ